MNPLPEHPWPPLITSAKVPWYIRARDWFFTLLAWLTLAYSLRIGVWLLWDYFSHPIFELTAMKAFDWGLMWERFSLFAYMILAVVAWITAWAVKRRTLLRRSFDPRVPPSLRLEDHAASLGFDPREIERWRQWRIVTVHFDGDRMANAEPNRRDAADARNPRDPADGGT